MQTTLKNKTKLSTKELIIIPLFSALICIGAFIKIPIGIVPVSLQTVFVLLAGLILGSRRGSIAVALYVTLGLIGLPVFTNGGGPQYVLSPTFGYLIGMIFGAFVTGLITEKTSRRNVFVNFGAAFLGLFVIYTFGVTWLFLIKNFYLGGQAPIGALIKAGFLVFLPAAEFWCVVSAIVGKRMAYFSHRLWLQWF